MKYGWKGTTQKWGEKEMLELLIQLKGTLLGSTAQALLLGVMTLGAYITYKILDYPDLSVDGTYALGGAISAAFIAQGNNPIISLVLATIGGMLGGLCTALLHTKLKMSGLLAGILTMLALYSVNLRIMGKANITLLGKTTINSMIKSVLPLTNEGIAILIGGILCAVLIAVLYWFFGTEVGSSLRAAGNNPKMARALGVSTDSMVILGLVLSNGLVGLSGALTAQYQSFADVGMGTGTMVMGLASIVIGEVVFRFMQGSFAWRLLSAVLGMVLYRAIIGIVLLIPIFTADDMKLFSALVVVLVFSISKLVDFLKGKKETHLAVQEIEEQEKVADGGTIA